MLNVQNLSVSFGHTEILKKVDFHVSPGQWLMIIGPNGAGKSTVINAVSGSFPYSGSIALDGKDIKQYKSRTIAQKMGILQQNHTVTYDFTVEEVVRLGCYAHTAGLLSPRANETKRVTDSLSKVGLEQCRCRSVLSLSGGELQRMFLAQVFAQNPQILLLDEPTNHLDLIYQQQIFHLVRQWLKHPGRAVVSVVHDLSLARMFGTHALLMNEGKTAAYGEMDQVITPSLLQSVYDMDVYDWMQQLYSQWEDENESCRNNQRNTAVG